MVDVENRDKWEDAQQVRSVAMCPHDVPTASLQCPCGVPWVPRAACCPQVSPGSVHLMKVVEDFIHLVGDALKAFQSSLIVTDNLGERRAVGRWGGSWGGVPGVTSAVPTVISIQREPVSAVSSDINFPMKGRRGMKDWARSSEDKLFIPREVLSLASAGMGVGTGVSVHVGESMHPGVCAGVCACLSTRGYEHACGSLCIYV